MVVVVIRPLDEPAPASSVAHWAGFADNRQGEMPALRVTDGDASTGHPLASRAEDAVDLTGARIAARQRTRIRQETWEDLFDNFEGDLERAIWIAKPSVWCARATSIERDVGLRDGTFKGAPALASSYAPDGMVLLVDPSGLSVSLGQIELDVSRQGSLSMDSAPSMDTGGLGSPVDAPSALTQVSLWETNAIAVRATCFANWSIGAGRIAAITTTEGSPL